MSASSSSTALEGPGNVGQFQVLKTMPRKEEALDLLKRLHSLCKPIQKKYGWYLPVLCEFFPSNPNLLGMNMNRGQKIFIRLRPQHDENSFMPLEESLVGTLLHEFTHNLHGPHNKDFYAFLDKLNDEYDALRVGGYSGEGFMSDGSRLGVSHNLPAHLAKAKALEEAEKRSKLAKIMGPPGGRTLGGTKAKLGKSPRELMADAAERRARDAKSCGQGEAMDDETVKEEMQRAEDLSQAVSGLTLEQGPASIEGQRLPTPEEESDNSDLELISAPPVARPDPAKLQKNKDLAKSSTVLGKRAAPPSPARKPAPVSSKVRPSAPRPDPPSKASQYWTCATCTFENSKSHALACEMCGTPKDGKTGWNPGDFLADDEQAFSGPALRNGLTRNNEWVCHRCGGTTENDYWTCRLCGILKLSS